MPTHVLVLTGLFLLLAYVVSVLWPGPRPPADPRLRTRYWIRFVAAVAVGFVGLLVAGLAMGAFLNANDFSHTRFRR